MRRYELDWLRVLVFMILIIYHVGMYFVPWEWHIKNNVLYDTLKYPMIFVSQWRLSILFIISGMGTAYAMSQRSAIEFAKERVLKLFIPLIFGILFIVPPQVYLERVTYNNYSSSYLDFWINEAFIGIYPNGNLSWHHLWFLPYLLFFSLLLIPLFVWLRNNSNHNWRNNFNNILNRTYGVYWVTLPFISYELFLKPYFPSTHDFIGDWYNHAKYLSLFLFGYLVICSNGQFWRRVRKSRNNHFLIGIVSFSLVLTGNHYYSLLKDFKILWILTNIARVVSMWAWIMCIFGFANRYLSNKSGKFLKYSTEAVYPFYIVHQTITVILGFLILNCNLHVTIKFAFMTIGTFGLSWLIYEYIIRRFWILRPLFGMKTNKK